MIKEYDPYTDPHPRNPYTRERVRRYEEWTSLSFSGFSKYEVSTQGRVRLIRTRRTLNPTKNSNGTVYVNLVDDYGRRRSKQLAKLVLTAFVGEHPYSKFTTIIFRDHDSNNAAVYNLLWGRRTDAIYRERAYASRGMNRAVNEGRILERNTGLIFDNANQAAEFFGCNAEHIVHLANRVVVKDYYGEERFEHYFED